MSKLLQSIIDQKLLKDTRLLEAVLEDPQAIPAINPGLPQTNIPPPVPNPAAVAQAKVSPATIHDGEDKQAQDGSNNTGAQPDESSKSKSESKRPRWEMESAMKNLDVIEYHLKHSCDESYMSEMDDTEKDKMEAIKSGMASMRQTMTEMMSSWGSDDKK